MPNSRTIILIDDDASVLRALGRVMSSAGFEWRGFKSAEEFFADPLPRQGDCIITDLALPVMSGMDLLSHLRIRSCEIPVILVTAHDSAEIRQSAQAAGASAFFRKPIDSQALLDAVEWVIRSPKTRA